MLYHTDLTYFPVLTGETPVLLAVLRFSYVLSKLNQALRHREIRSADFADDTD